MVLPVVAVSDLRSRAGRLSFIKKGTITVSAAFDHLLAEVMALSLGMRTSRHRAALAGKPPELTSAWPYGH
jgi:hypothetical protein